MFLLVSRNNILVKMGRIYDEGMLVVLLLAHSNTGSICIGRPAMAKIKLNFLMICLA